MNQSLSLVTVVVRDYEEALAFFVGKLGFVVREDRFVPEQDKRWIVIAPAGSGNAGIVLGRATDDSQIESVGNQTGGRVFLFLQTDNFWRDFEEYRSRGIRFVRPPQEQPYGIVAVFEDLYGNLWDLVQPRDAATI